MYAVSLFSGFVWVPVTQQPENRAGSDIDKLETGEF